MVGREACNKMRRGARGKIDEDLVADWFHDLNQCRDRGNGCRFSRPVHVDMFGADPESHRSGGYVFQPISDCRSQRELEIGTLLAEQSFFRFAAAVRR